MILFYAKSMLFVIHLSCKRILTASIKHFTQTCTNTCKYTNVYAWYLQMHACMELTAVKYWITKDKKVFDIFKKLTTS